MLSFALQTMVLWGLQALPQEENGYLEVPIVGHFGEEITARGVEEALKAAACLGARHVVFNIDSKGGNQLAAQDVYHVLGKYEKQLRYHAVLSEATGVALAMVVWCDDVFMRPGSRVGGVNLVVDESRYPGIEPRVVLLNLALMAGENARRHGRAAELVRAMIDPSEAVHVYRDREGKTCASPNEPDVTRENLLLDHAAGKVLTLDDHQAVQVGFARPYEGTISGLGKELGLSDWVSKGDEGRIAMTAAAQSEQVRLALVRTDRQRFLIEQNLKRREAAKAAVERFLNLANEWNPKLETYSTYKERSHLWDGYWDGWNHDTGRLTPEARRKWKDRTDITVAALAKARTGVGELLELEKEAKSLGQESLYPPGKLEALRLDLELKIAMLVRERDKRFKDDQ